MILANRIQVVVAGQVFSIPAEKQSELMQILARWQSIAMAENQNPINNKGYDGLKLING